MVAVTREPTLRAILNSLIMAGAETLAVVVTSVITAYPFARLRFRGRDAVFLMVLGTMMIPAQVTMVPTFILLRWLGWIDTYQGLIVPRIVTPLGIFLIRQFLLTLPRELEEAARIDGCGRLATLQPGADAAHLGPAVATLAIFTFTASWNEFFWPLIVVQSSEMRTIQLLIAALKQTEAVEWGVVMAIVTLSVLPTVAIYLALQKYFAEGHRHERAQGVIGTGGPRGDSAMTRTTKTTAVGRRTFLRTTGAAGAGLALGAIPGRAPAQTKKHTVNIWIHFAGKNYEIITRLIDEFNQATPDVEVKHDVLRADRRSRRSTWRRWPEGPRPTCSTPRGTCRRTSPSTR